MEFFHFVQQDLQLVRRWQDGHSERREGGKRTAIINSVYWLNGDGGLEIG